jgi:hypothetical protein
MSSRPKNRFSHKQYGFNLVEVALALTFFGISFSALLLGVQSIITANLQASQVHAENNAVNDVLNRIDFYRLDVEALNDLANVRQQMIVRNNGNADNSNSQRLFYDLNVYSQPRYPDIKIAELTLYKRANATQVYRRFQRKMNLNTECHNYGATTVVQINGLTCIPVPSTANRASSSATAYTGTGAAMANQQVDLALFNPRNDNVWGGFITTTVTNPTIATTPTVPASVGGILPASTNPLLDRGLIFSRAAANREAATSPYPQANVRLVMPASSDTINTTINTSLFRYSLEVGVLLRNANAILRVFPIASNVAELTNSIGFLEYRAENANRMLTVRIDDLRPMHDDVTDRPIVGVALLVLNQPPQAASTATNQISAPGAITSNSEDVVVTHMIKRLYTET